MFLHILKSKIHCATVTEANLHYMGSITIDEELMEAAGLMIRNILSDTDIASLISGHFIDNPASGRVMEKCGFIPTGEECFDESLYGGEGRPIRVLRLIIRKPS